MTLLVLTVLQLLGLALAAGAAAANLVKSKGVEEIKTPSPIIGAPATITRRLTREAQIGVRLLIAGLFVSLVAKSVEQYLTSRRNAENQRTTVAQLQRADDQIAKAREILNRLQDQSRQTASILTNVAHQAVLTAKSLDSVERVLTRIHKITARVWFALPTNEPSFKRLHADFSHFATNGYGAFAKAGQVEEIPFGRADRPHAFTIDLKDLSREDLKTAIPSLRELDTLFSGLRNANFYIAILKEPRKRPISLLLFPDTETADLQISSPGSSLKASVVYTPETNQLYIEWSGIESTDDTWFANGKVVGLNDLAGAHLLLAFDAASGRSPSLIAKFWMLQPILLVVSFDHHPVPLTTFRRQLPSADVYYFDFILPPEDRIMSASTYLNPVPL